jgi:hypothetical protein
MVIDMGQQGSVKRIRFEGKLFGGSADVRRVGMPAIGYCYPAHFLCRFDTNDRGAKPLSQ